MYFIHGAQTAYDSKGDPVGDFSPSDFALTGAYSYGFGRGIRVGAGIKAIRSSLQSESAAAAAVDLGAQFLRVVELGDGPLDLGLSVSNLGMPMSLGGVSQPLPMSLSGGVLWRVNPMLNATMDTTCPWTTTLMSWGRAHGRLGQGRKRRLEDRLTRPHARHRQAGGRHRGGGLTSAG